jgi:hypothetical protein
LGHFEARRKTKKMNKTNFVKHLLVVLALLFTHIDESYAQSGWLLWHKIIIYTTDTPTSWHLMNAYPTYQVCKEKMKLSSSQTLSGLKDWPGIANVQLIEKLEDPKCGFRMLFQNGLKVSHEYYCFPESIDPKAK